MLSYEDSKELERLGYSQELKHGDWYYNKSDNEASILAQKKFGPFLYCMTCHEDEPPERPIKVPTTDGMIEGLGDKIRCIYPLVNAWAIETYDVAGELNFGGRKETDYDRFVRDKLEQALCELWKKVKG